MKGLRSFCVRVGGFIMGVTDVSPSDALITAITEWASNIDAAFDGHSIGHPTIVPSEVNGRVTISIVETTSTAARGEAP